MTCSYKAFSDILILALTIRCRGCHNKAGTAFFIQITVEIGNPKIVSVSDFFAFVNTGHTKWQSACIFAGFGFYFIHVKRRIRHYIVTATVQIMCIMIKTVSLITRFDNTGKTMHSHIHQAKLRIVFYLFLTIKCHCTIGIHAHSIYKIS